MKIKKRLRALNSIIATSATYTMIARIKIEWKVRGGSRSRGIYLGTNDTKFEISFPTNPILALSFQRPEMVKDEDLKELAHLEYWDQRYASAEKESKDGSAVIASFEWFRTFENLRPFFEKHLPAASSGCYILHLGCGNSVSPIFCLHSGFRSSFPLFHSRQRSSIWS